MQIAQILARLLARRRRSAPPRDGQEEARGDGEAEGRRFVDGAKAKEVDVKPPTRSSSSWRSSPGYGFNRSHSAAYGWITYQTAFLKYHYPHEFMAGLMSCDADNIDNIVKFIAEARSMGLVVERPDVNESIHDFTVVADARDTEGDPVRPRRGQGRRRERGRGDHRGARDRGARSRRCSSCAAASTPRSATGGCSSS